MLAPRFVFCLPTTVEAVRLASLYIQSYSSVTLFLIQLRTDYCLGEGRWWVKKLAITSACGVKRTCYWHSDGQDCSTFSTQGPHTFHGHAETP